MIIGNLKARKISVLLLACLILVCIITACAGNDTKGKNDINENNIENNDSSLVEETQNPYSEFPKVKMDGRVFRILMPEYIVERNYVISEVETGETLNDAAFMRNIEIEDKFDIVIEARGGDMNCHKELSKLVSSGDDSIDLVIPHPTTGITAMVTDGLLLNWNDMKYIDFTKPCWNTDMQNALAIGNKLFYACGDVTVTSQGLGEILFNKEIAQNFGLENPYKYVFDGVWTMDKLSEIIKGVSTDLNGDGVMDKNDMFGYVSTASDSGYLWSCGIKIARNNEEGRPVLAMMDDRMASTVDKLYNLLYGGDAYLEYGKKGQYVDGCKHFADGKALTVVWDIGTYWMDMRPIEFDFGILPKPKLNEIQENYYGMVAAGIMGIPLNVKDPENTSIIIQAYAEGSYKYLHPAFIDVVLYNKCLRDEESQKILEMIFDNKVYDFGFSFDANYNLAYILNEVVLRGGSTDFVSYYEKYAEGTQANFDKIYEICMNNEN